MMLFLYRHPRLNARIQEVNDEETESIGRTSRCGRTGNRGGRGCRGAGAGRRRVRRGNFIAKLAANLGIGEDKLKSAIDLTHTQLID